MKLKRTWNDDCRRHKIDSFRVIILYYICSVQSGNLTQSADCTVAVQSADCARAVHARVCFGEITSKKTERIVMIL